MNVIDSSAWLEYFANGPNADEFAPAIEAIDELVVPSIVIYEVFKRVLWQRSEAEALQAIAMIQQGMVVDLTASLAIESAKTGRDLKLPLADSIVLTTARAYGATLWTQDADFQGIDGVEYRAKQK